MRTRSLALIAAVAMLSQACSSRPRTFEPMLGAAPADQEKFASEYRTCERLLVEGKLDSEGRLASVATGAGAVTAVGAAGGLAASSAGLHAGAGIASLTLVALPFVAIGGAWGMAKAKRKKKEAAVKRVMAGCLLDRGYSVTGWTPAGKTKGTARPAGTEN